MATHMPALGSGQHYASVNYACVFGTITTGGGRVSFANPGGTAFVFFFETGRTQPDPQVDLWDVAWDYSWFDQDAEEAAITARLGDECAGIAGLLGVPVAEVQQSVTISRVWTVAANVQGSAAAQQYATCTVTEIMPYPVTSSGADAAAAAESESVASA